MKSTEKQGTQFQMSQSDIVSLANDEHITLGQLFKNIWNIGLITFGGPISHISILRGIYVDKLKTISDQKFMELMTLCQSFPGPTSTQLLISLSMYATSSFTGGFMAFILFSLPTFLIMYIAALIMGVLQGSTLEKLQLFGQVLQIIAVSIIIQAFWKLSEKYRKRQHIVGLILIPISAVIYTGFAKVQIMFLLLGVGGTIYLIKSYVRSQNSNAQQIGNQSQRDRFGGLIYGWKNLFIFFMLLFAVLLLNNTCTPQQIKGQTNIQDKKICSIFVNFYQIGSLTIGGGHVILPLMLNQFAQYQYFTQAQFWNGFALVSTLPGPMFNFSVYIGTLIQRNILGALVAAFGLYLPCWLFVLFGLPVWQTIRKYDKISQFINGMCCVSIGFILSAAIILFYKNIQGTSDNVGKIVKSITMLIGLFLLQKGVSIWKVFILSIIWWGLYNYTQLVGV